MMRVSYMLVEWFPPHHTAERRPGGAIDDVACHANPPQSSSSPGLLTWPSGDWRVENAENL
jgi:hypothetical protein